MIQNEVSSAESIYRSTHAERAGLVIRSLRNFFGMSQGELAEVSGVSRPTISRLEKLEAGTSLRATTLDQIIQVFADRGVRVHFLHNDVKIELPDAAILGAVKAVRKR